MADVIVDIADVMRTIYAIAELQGSAVAVAAPGVHQPRSVHMNKAGKKKRAYSRAASFSRKRVMIADLIRWHEYGPEKYDVNFPARSFVRSTLQDKRADIDKVIEGVVRRVIASKGKWRAEDAHKVVGHRIVSELRRKLKSGVPPELSEATKSDPDRDQRMIPLIDTGQIHDSLTYRSEGL